MEELRNIKLEWKSILFPQIRVLKEKYPEMDAEKMYEPLVEMLSFNRIPSRVFMSEGKPVCYGYILPPVGLDDRIVCSMGFSEDDNKFFSKGKQMLDWFKSKAQPEKKLLIVDGIFNGNFLINQMKDLSFNRIYRVKLLGENKLLVKMLENIKNKVLKDETNFIEIENEEIQVEQAEKAQLEAYSESPDKFLLIRKGIENITHQITKSGYYGKLLNSPSKILHNGKEVIGSIQVTDGSYEFLQVGVPLLVDIFVNKNYRGKGFGKFLLYIGSSKLSNLGFQQMQLWVNKDSNVYEFYKKLGFKENGEDDLMFYLDFRSVI
jgi:GNAT superfamily N-acetyltransferase